MIIEAQNVILRLPLPVIQPIGGAIKQQHVGFCELHRHGIAEPGLLSPSSWSGQIWRGSYRGRQAYQETTMRGERRLNDGLSIAVRAREAVHRSRQRVELGDVPGPAKLYACLGQVMLTIGLAEEGIAGWSVGPQLGQHGGGPRAAGRR